jgi:murein DD-endopeptidase MepM/ murein hydrolase activator NlpD
MRSSPRLLARRARLQHRLVCTAALVGVLALASLPVRAQEPAATLVISTPTPTPTPTPFLLPTVTPVPGAGSTSPLATPTPASPAATAVSAWALPVTAQGAPPAASTGTTLPFSGEGYVVQEGDTLLDAALELGLDVEEVGCTIAPHFDPAQPLVIGDVLLPLPATVRCVRSASGDTVRILAERLSLAPESLLGEPWNQLAGFALDAPLPPGRFVRHPGTTDVQVAAALAGQPGNGPSGEFVTWMLAQPAGVAPQSALATGGVRRPQGLAPVPADWPYGTGVFQWPTYGFLTQGYRFDHRALDIAAVTGTPVTASDRGVVIRAGWNNQGYGNFVIVDHKIDYLTLYAHLDTVFVKEGEVVAQGQVVGTVGATGNTTGPHLHFELRDFGRLANPLEYLAR